jgi:hypothetical protein
LVTALNLHHITTAVTIADAALAGVALVGAVAARRTRPAPG